MILREKWYKHLYGTENGILDDVSMRQLEFVTCSFALSRCLNCAICSSKLAKAFLNSFFSSFNLETNSASSVF